MFIKNKRPPDWLREAVRTARKNILPAAEIRTR
jgi:hypothetical protein